ncbi:hypothetical protein Hanom_Chr02g00160691 [Helianthus anomalus]
MTKKVLGDGEGSYGLEWRWSNNERRVLFFFFFFCSKLGFKCDSPTLDAKDRSNCYSQCSSWRWGCLWYALDDFYVKP